jgi:bacteriocin-like protein
MSAWQSLVLIFNPKSKSKQLRFTQKHKHSLSRRKMLTSNNTRSQASSASSYLLTELTQDVEELTEQELKLVTGGASVQNRPTRLGRPGIIRLPIDPQPLPLPDI